MEEIDLCWRIRLAGRQVWAIPESHVYHLGGGSLPASNPKKTYLNFRNNLLMLHKNLPACVRTKRLLWRRILDAMAWCKFIAGFDLKNASAVLKAHRDYRRMCRLYDRCDAKVDLLDGEVNILTEYFMKGHKRFSDLQK